MPITIRKYQSTDKEQLIRIMNNFQDYIVSIDDMHLTRRMAGYGKVYVKQTLKELKENNGVMYIAENEQKTIIGIVSGIIEKPSKIYKFECVPVKSGRLTENAQSCLLRCLAQTEMLINFMRIQDIEIVIKI